MNHEKGPPSLQFFFHMFHCVVVVVVVVFCGGSYCLRPVYFVLLYFTLKYAQFVIFFFIFSLVCFIRFYFLFFLILNERKQSASRFNLTYRYIDNVWSINNPEFENYLGQMYPFELDPAIIERTIGLVLGPFTALYRSFLKRCTLTNKAVGTK